MSTLRDIKARHEADEKNIQLPMVANMYVHANDAALKQCHQDRAELIAMVEDWRKRRDDMSIVHNAEPFFETGVAVEYNGKFWGKLYEDGRETNWGWGDITVADLSDPHYIKRPSDKTYRGSHYIPELNKGRLVMLTRIVHGTFQDFTPRR